MAQIHEEVIAIKFSKLFRNNEKTTTIVTSNLLSTLSDAAQELAGDGVIVEIIQNFEE
jgi:hypothetical protein